MQGWDNLKFDYFKSIIPCGISIYSFKYTIKKRRVFYNISQGHNVGIYCRIEFMAERACKQVDSLFASQEKPIM